MEVGQQQGAMSKRERKRARNAKRREQKRRDVGGEAGAEAGAANAKRARQTGPPPRSFRPEACLLPRTGDASALGLEFFAWMIHPVTVEDFYRDYWEKKPLVVKRKDPSYYRGWLGLRDVEAMLEQGAGLRYGEDVDVTAFRDGTRTTLNGEGHAPVEEVWSRFREGCSVRLLHPQTHSDAVWRMLAMLETHWGSFAGCNAYLTPRGTQGFAPHFDDIEAFLLQVEGTKRWKLHRPVEEGDVLPRESSRNYRPEEVGKPMMEVALEPGDLLYFPRGVIHQATTDDASPHSLHLTLSTAQRNTWIDLMEHGIPMAMDEARAQHMVLRRSLPADYLHFMGLQHQERGDASRRSTFRDLFHSLLSKVVDSLKLDEVADEMAMRLLQDSLPPVLDADALRCRWRGLDQDMLPLPEGAAGADGAESADGSDSGSEDEDGGAGGGEGVSWMERQPAIRARRAAIPGRGPLGISDSVRLLRRGAARIIPNPEGEGAVVYHLVHNSRLHHGEELSGVAVSPEEASACEALFNAYPMFACVRDLPMERADDRVALANKLFRHGIVLAEAPAPPKM